MAQVAEIQVVDEYTLRLVTTGPAPDIPANMANVEIVPMQYLQQVGDEEFGRNPVGTGPYFGRANYGQYCNPELDAVIKKVNTTIDPKERIKYFNLAAEMIHEDVPKIPLHSEELIVGVSNKFDFDIRVDEQIWAKEIKLKQ